MLEKAIKGSKVYWGWIAFLLLLMSIGAACYWQQLSHGLTITGMSRDVTWGFYIAQFTFLVGVAASAVMLVIPKYLHDYQKFGKILILGEFNAVAMVILCLLFIVADLGSPQRLMNVLAASDAQFRSLLGYGGAERLSAHQYPGGLGDA